MESLFIPATQHTPTIFFDSSQNILTLKGESYIEYPQEFYQPAFNWLARYLKKNRHPFTVNFQILYFNTPSSAVFFEMFDLFKQYQTSCNIPIQVNWFVQANDHEMIDDGEMFRADFPTLDFKVIIQKKAFAA